MMITLTQSARLSPATRRASLRPGFSSSSRLVRVRSEDPKITREYREDDDTVLNNLDQMVGGTAKEQQEAEAPKAGGSSSGYIDDMPEIPRTEMSDAMKEKLRREYYSLGGSPNKSMGSNYFLNIILVISALAIASAALGYL